MKTDMISAQTLRRLPVYLHYLNSMRHSGKNISATAIAEYFGLNDVQVRKDLCSISGSGRPKTGYVVDELADQLEAALGCRTTVNTVLAGAGNLGKALLCYGGFSDYGLDIIAAFDTNPELIGTNIGGKPIYPLDKAKEICENNDIRLGIITVPVGAAQGICDIMTSLGLRAIWNFAPTILRAPKGVLVENENLASSLAILSKHLRDNSLKDLREGTDIS